jgi:hypothetical protein
MTEDPSSSPNAPSFSSADAPEPDWGTPDESDGPASALAGRSSFALDMARMWVKEHQTSVMLGAFAVGVAAGALFRD